MPLILHPSSQCDVCLIEYSWDEGGKRPYAIACGHIFCSSCLFENTPPRCPICRRTYQPNKMKLLHVGKPDEVDDNKEVDLLQRLAILWGAPDDQLLEIVQEVDAWLQTKSEQACVALRKARVALRNYLEMKDSHEILLNEITMLRQELQGLHTSSIMNTQQYESQNKKMAKKIDKQKSIISRLRWSSEFGRSPNSNPLPSPPQPVATPDLPSFVEVYSQSAPGGRMVNLPSSPAYEYDPEREVFARSRTRSNEALDPHDSTTYYSPEINPHSHYVQPHIARHHERSPQRRSRLNQHFETTAPSNTAAQDPYRIVEATVTEYANGFVSGAEAAMGIGHHGTDPHSVGIHRPENNTHSTRRHRHAVPHSAPLPVETSPRRDRRRYNTSSSIIPTSAPILAQSPPRRPRSTSRSDASRSSHPRPPITDPRLAMILSGTSPEQSSIHNPLPSRTQQPRVPTAPVVEPVVVQNFTVRPQQPLQPTRPVSPSVTVNSWGTGRHSNLTDGSVIQGLLIFRDGTNSHFEGGDSQVRFRPLGSDGQSIHTSPPQSVGDIDSEAGSQPGSPVRPVGSMVGVLPEERTVRPEGARSSTYSEVRTWPTNTWPIADYNNYYRHQQMPSSDGMLNLFPTDNVHDEHTQEAEPAVTTHWRHDMLDRGRVPLRNSVALPNTESPVTHSHHHHHHHHYVPERDEDDEPRARFSENALGLDLAMGASTRSASTTPSAWNQNF